MLRRIFLSECLNNSETTLLFCVARSASVSSSTFITANLHHFIQDEEKSDVYVANFFEQIVLQYCDTTFRRHFRLTRECMQILIEHLTEMLDDQSVNRMTVCLAKKLHFALWMLANHAVSFRSATDLFGLSKGTGHLIFIEICSAIPALKSHYIVWPTSEERRENEDNVFDSHGFPGVIGCIDGCHIPIKAPINNPFDFYNQFIDVFIGMFIGKST